MTNSTLKIKAATEGEHKDKHPSENSTKIGIGALSIGAAVTTISTVLIEQAKKVVTVFPIQQGVTFTVNGAKIIFEKVNPDNSLLFKINGAMATVGAKLNCVGTYNGQCQSFDYVYQQASANGVTVNVSSHAYPVIEVATGKIAMGVTVSTPVSPEMELLRAGAIGVMIGGAMVLAAVKRDKIPQKANNLANTIKKYLGHDSKVGKIDQETANNPSFSK